MRLRVKSRSAYIPTMNEMLVPSGSPQQHSGSSPSNIEKRSVKRKFNSQEVYGHGDIESIPLCGAVEPSKAIVESMLADELDTQGQHHSSICELEICSTETPTHKPLTLDNVTTPSTLVPNAAAVKQIKTPTWSREKVGKICTIFENQQASTKIVQPSSDKGNKLACRKISTAINDELKTSPPTCIIVDDVNTFPDAKLESVMPATKGKPCLKTCNADICSPIDDIIRQSEKKNVGGNIGNGTPIKPVLGLSAPTRSLTREYKNVVKGVSADTRVIMDSCDPEETMCWTTTPAVATQQTPVLSRKRRASAKRPSYARRIGPDTRTLDPSDILSPDSLFMQKKHIRKSRTLLSLDYVFSPKECSTLACKTTVKSTAIETKHATVNDSTHSSPVAVVGNCESSMDGIETLNDMEYNPSDQETHVTVSENMMACDEASKSDCVNTRIRLPSTMETHSNDQKDDDHESAPAMSRFDGTEFDSSDDESCLTDYDDDEKLNEGKMPRSSKNSPTDLLLHLEVSEAESDLSDQLSNKVKIAEDSTESDMDSSPSETKSTVESAFSDVQESEQDTGTVSDSEEYYAVPLYMDDVHISEPTKPKCLKRSRKLFNDKNFMNDSQPPFEKRSRINDTHDREENNNSAPIFTEQGNAKPNLTHESETHDNLLPYDSIILGKLQSIRGVTEMFSDASETDQTTKCTVSKPEPQHGAQSGCNLNTKQPDSNHMPSEDVFSPSSEPTSHILPTQQQLELIDSDEIVNLTSGISDQLVLEEELLSSFLSRNPSAGEVEPVPRRLAPSAPVYYEPDSQVDNLDAFPADSTTECHKASGTMEHYSYLSEEIYYSSLTKMEPCLYQSNLHDTVPKAGTMALQSIPRVSMNTSINTLANISDEEIHTYNHASATPPVVIASVQPDVVPSVQPDVVPSVQPDVVPSVQYDVVPSVKRDIIPSVQSDELNNPVSTSSQTDVGASVIAKVESVVAARVRKWRNQYGSADNETGDEFQLPKAMKEIKPYVISGWISAPYLRALMNKTDMISEMFDNTMDSAGEVHVWILENCRKNTPAILARDLVFRIFTLGELYNFNMRKLSRSKLAAIRRCLKKQFQLDYNVNVWKGKCIPLIKSSVRTLFKHRVKDVQSFWLLHS